MQHIDAKLGSLVLRRDEVLRQQDQMRNMLAVVSTFVACISVHEGWNRLSTAEDPYSAVALDAVTAAAALANAGFVRLRSVRAFQLALILAVQQVVVWAQSQWARGEVGRTHLMQLEADQWPMGAVLFGMTWLGDRLMHRVIEDANKALTEVVAL
eukprot:CAMPEP_0118947926 /NCGR_PEP_ID=MMETSP1169-20130426/46904_1 /TAXON_ID=36882 /ORGANISM="Pyramimonas obovata, Strain CCMP722" /LENGTH=154 /DNA_ID=CAMNT_0006894235 /DNA_START=241 /DNA_END=701 /DNA_ORIENTATION=+